MGVKDALLRHHQKQLKRTVRRKNKKPEKIVEQACIKWMRAHGFDVDIIEASGGRNVYGGVTVKSGYCDCSGNDRLGRAVYVEFKAKGRRANLSEKQRQFLERKIKTNAFAVVIDSADLLEEYYNMWQTIKCPVERCKYLLDLLPKKRKVDDDGELF